MIFCKHLSVASVLCFALLATIAGAMSAAEIAGEKNQTREAMDQQCQDLLRQQQKFAEDQKAENTEMHERALAINRAPEDKKMALMSGLLMRLVEQNAATAQRSEKLQKAMLAHLMKHVQLATPAMTPCLMLNDSTDMKDLKNMHDSKSPNNEIAK